MSIREFIMEITSRYPLQWLRGVRFIHKGHLDFAPAEVTIDLEQGIANIYYDITESTSFWWVTLAHEYTHVILTDRNKEIGFSMIVGEPNDKLTEEYFSKGLFQLAVRVAMDLIVEYYLPILFEDLKYDIYRSSLESATMIRDHCFVAPRRCLGEAIILRWIEYFSGRRLLVDYKRGMQSNLKAILNRAEKIFPYVLRALEESPKKALKVGLIGSTLAIAKTRIKIIEVPFLAKWRHEPWQMIGIKVVE